VEWVSKRADRMIESAWAIAAADYYFQVKRMAWVEQIRVGCRL
jgi:hypothetical protein